MTRLGPFGANPYSDFGANLTQAKLQGTQVLVRRSVSQSNNLLSTLCLLPYPPLMYD